ncbi:MAG: hypothetical protein L7S67_05265 [Flavobacteriales bacterium]|nr:hypothetical protein [Flavobacteriales bacterium]
MLQPPATAMVTACNCGWICAVLLMGGCKPPAPETTPDTVVATAYGQSLTASELMEGLPEGLSSADSAARADRAISEWLERQTIVHLAETELPEEERDFDRTVNRYRESLFIHAYEDLYLRDHLDTSLTAEELQTFLEAQPDLFRLDVPLFRARWMVFADDQPFPRDVKDLSKQLASKNAEKLSALASRCTDAGIPFDLEANRWWTWEELGQRVPLEPKRAYRQQSSRWVSKIQWKADTAMGRPFDQRALLLVTERLPKGSVSPLERVADRISELLLHRRRNLTLEAMRQQAVQTAWAEAALSSGTDGPSTPAPANANDRTDTP